MRPDGWTILPRPKVALGSRNGPVTIRHPGPAVALAKTFEPPLAPAWHRLDLAYRGEGIVDARLVLVLADGSRLPHHLAKTARNRFTGLFRPAAPLARVEIEASGSAALDSPALLSFAPVSSWQRHRALLRRTFDVLTGDPRSFPWRLARFLVQVSRQGRTTIPVTTAARTPERAYALWRERFDERPEAEAAFHAMRARRLVGGPLFSVVAGRDFAPEDISALAASLERQIYGRWELFLPDGAQARPGADPRFRSDGRPSASQTHLAGALARAEGSFVLLPGPGMVLRPHALLVLAETAADVPGAGLIYADEDRLDRGLRRTPRFKPAWSPQRLAAFDYVGDPCGFATEMLRALGAGVEADTDLQRYDLLLRASERLPPGGTVHVAQVLAHATKHTPTPARGAGAVLARRARRLGIQAEIAGDPRSPYPRTIFAVPATPPRVSLIIPTRDRADLLRMSVGSIRNKTAYPLYEVIVVDNGSREAETFRLFEGWAGDPSIRVVRHEGPFNYAELNNRAVAAARGSVLGLVNNDIEVIEGGWLDEMVGLALQPGVGCVGAKLTYPDGRLQHGGVVTGIAGAAGHRRKRAPRADPGDLGDLVTVNEVSAVTAACLVVRKEIYEAVGGLDAEHFAVAYNDVDFCLKVGRAGHRNLWTPFAELVHHESLSRGRDLGPQTAERFNRETMNLRLRWGDRLLDDPYSSPNLTVDAETGAIRTQ